MLGQSLGKKDIDGDSATEIQQQCREHDKSVQDKVKKLERLVAHHDDCETNAELPNETLIAELPGLQLLDYKTHSGLKPFATRKMASTEFSILNTMFRRDADDEHWVKAVLNHPAACVMNTEDSHSIVWDSGASMCISNDKADFEGAIKSMPNAKVDGINSHLELEGFGTVNWTMLDTNAKLRSIKLPAHYAPKARQKLLSTSTFSKMYPHDEMKITPKSWTIKRNPNKKDEADIEVLISPVNNLPMSICMRPDTVKRMAINFAEDPFATSRKNKNLNEPKKELLWWHYRLGHIGLRTVQFLFRTGALATTQAMRRLHERAANVTPAEMPRCAACQFGKQTNRVIPGTIRKEIEKRKGVMSAERLLPGERVYVDHFQCAARGRLFTGDGKYNHHVNTKRTIDENNSHCGGAVLVDAATGHIGVEFQTTLNQEETVKATQRYEDKAKDYGMIVKECQFNNAGAFTSKQLNKRLKDNDQGSRHSGPGSHHQNGQAERAIRTIMAMARTMLIHQAAHWSQQLDATAETSRWPMAVRLATHVYNHAPKMENGLTPHELWTRTKEPVGKLNNLHAFGCPVYVLKKAIADGKKIPRWENRSVRGMHMGVSEKHAGDVPLVLNTETGKMTPQWNIIFDDWFSTITMKEEDLPDFYSPEWSETFDTKTYSILNEDEDGEDSAPVRPQRPSLRWGPRATDDDRQDDTLKRSHQALNQPHREIKPVRPGDYVRAKQVADQSLTQTMGDGTVVSKQSVESMVAKNEGDDGMRMSPTPYKRKATPSTPQTSNKMRDTTDRIEPSSAELPHRNRSSASAKPQKLSWEDNTKSETDSIPTRKSGRQTKQTTKLTYGHGAIQKTVPANEPPDMIGLVEEEFITQDMIEHIANHCRIYLALCGIGREREVDLDEEAIACLARLDELNPHQFAQVFKAAKGKNPDIPSYEEAMADYENSKDWLASALKEIRQLEKKGVWRECQKSEAKGQQIIPCTWVFRCKRNPAGEIIKCKARICLRGDLMEDNSNACAPVVQSPTIKIFIDTALKKNWIMISVDWVDAFPQAKLKKPLFVHTPRGFRNRCGRDGCLRLGRSLYGSKFAPLNWYEHLLEALLKLGFKQCPHDPCLLYRPGMMIILYVDNAGIAAPCQQDIEKFVEELRSAGFDLEIEGDFTEHLGIAIDKEADGTRCVHQKGLIKKIIETTKMTSCNPNHTPAMQVALGSDPEGAEWKNEDWNYASVVGMLLCVSNNTRPDIAFAVSQVARFTSNPKVSHASAIKSIVRYLKGTIDKGLVFTVNDSYDLTCWADADFAGLFGGEPPSSRDSVKSRYGCVIEFGGVPLVWKSQLMSETCTSTCHVEYVGLSNALKRLLPIRRLVMWLLEQLDLPKQNLSIGCKVFEDNQSAYTLATNQQLSVRTKCFAIKCHWFWDHVYHEKRNPKGFIHIEECSADLMNADYLTKGLQQIKFEANRKRVQGWQRESYAHSAYFIYIHITHSQSSSHHKYCYEKES